MLSVTPSALPLTDISPLRTVCRLWSPSRLVFDKGHTNSQRDKRDYDTQ